ncbi:MAG TPA: hypothetical protein VHB46_01715 [Burkholderiales bacterium]|nr:hypothetical protein [Burkholderiales bacterium]
MTKLCGEVKALSGPIGGGVHVTDTKYVYADGSPSEVKRNWYKSRMVFPTIQIGDTQLSKVFVANDQLGHDIAGNIHVGDKVCFFTYGHLLRKQVIIGVKSEKGPSFTMPARGLMSGLLWYAVFSPIVVGIPAIIIGMILGMVAGKAGTAYGLLLGVLYAVGISWFSGYRFYKTFQEMRASNSRFGFRRSILDRADASGCDGYVRAAIPKAESPILTLLKRWPPLFLRPRLRANAGRLSGRVAMANVERGRESPACAVHNSNLSSTDQARGFPQ